ncbi:HD domain-containing phosphohydrolase [Candidatus Contubernalis alkaliaceticus]|uniref:HD domain-containing phosphohydrolase n=1 Tax=Candidatus Contubernalis alkaliaceticus TaxID=338645 RepID=UPI001F4C4CFB|nr:HD domain-containing phosphohydrolase [Candidatus Contubernalis alkalaceticus]UNC91632.1 response regulator [Candidatus Contubernalis alkalaceticus]
MGKVLIVDDEKSMRYTLREFLRREGYEVEAAEDAVKALALLKQDAFDVVVTDIIMPCLSGVELLEQIRNIMPDLQVILMTGEPTVETAVKAVQVGAYDYISKPILKSTLLKVVKKALHLKEITDKKQRLEEANRHHQENLEQLVEERTRALHQSMQSSIKVLASMLDLRDPYTAGHQRRAGNLASAIGRELGLSNNVIEGLRVTGYLHDIGKIALPAEILAKPGKINELEYEIIKTHAAQGYTILKDLELPWPVAQVVCQHHERLDGSGYPIGLKNEDILTEAKILMVADVVEAMSSHRPYRTSLGIEMALEEIEENSGRLYDPQAVTVCLQLFRDKGYKITDSFSKTNFFHIH